MFCPQNVLAYFVCTQNKQLLFPYTTMTGFCNRDGVFTARYVLDIYIYYKLILTLVCKWYKKQGLEVFTERKNVLTGHRIPVIGFLARHFTEFSQLPVQKRRETVIRHVRRQKGGRFDLNPGDKIR